MQIPAASLHPLLTPPDSDDRLDRLDALAAVYLALPLLIFALTWLRPLPGAALLLAVLVALSPFLRARRAVLGWHWAAGALLLALVWTALGGAGHFFHANPFDWVTRDAVLRDLVVVHWPVYFDIGDTAALLLRAPLAYYLAPAAAAKLAGLSMAQWLLYAWTAMGVALGICLGLQGTRNTWHRLLWLLLLPWFSGMDAIGWWLERPEMFPAGGHIEWWARAFQFSSQTTQLFWAPNHAIPSWIAAAWCIKHWQRSTMLAPAILLVAVAPLWTPLLCVPIAVFGLVWLFARPGRWRELLQPRLLIPAAAAVAAALVVGLWVTAAAASVPFGSTVHGQTFEADVARLLKFGFLEWALVALLVVRLAPGSLLLPVVILLGLLPFVGFGPGNDLASRASILPLSILWWLAAARMAQRPPAGDIGRPLLALVLAIGALTPLQEVLRAVREPRWEPNLTLSFPEAVPVKTQPHYFIDYTKLPAHVAALLRSPAESGIYPARTPAYIPTTPPP